MGRSGGKLTLVSRQEEVSDRAARQADKHRDESGIVFDVRWPVSNRLLPSTTESVSCVGEEGGFLGRRFTFYRHRTSRRRPVFVSVRPGRYVLALSSEGHRHGDEMTLEIQVEPTDPIVVTCWPAKRGFLSPGRRQTSWVVTRPTQA